ncbi:hypothetical protein C8R43DRAFT_1200798 [Mycena crocata]|nr:hypothetical protein C8R43DRAFT_1200798 [Mycena crocata]
MAPHEQSPSQYSSRIASNLAPGARRRTTEGLKIYLPSVLLSQSKTIPTHEVDPGSRYIFYRFYSPSAAIVSRNAFDPTDPFLGRIKLTSIPPPRTIDCLKRCLAHAENLVDPTNQRIELYPTICGDSPVLDDTLSVVGGDFGSSPQSALALVLRQDLSTAEKANVGGIQVPDNFRISPGILEGRRRRQAAVAPLTRFLYYRLFTPETAIPSSAAFHPKDRFIGRIDIMRIPPPHTVATLSRCLVNAENIPHQYLHPTLFSSMASDSPMPPTLKISLLRDGPGSTPEDPLAVVLPGNPGLRRTQPETQGFDSSSQYLYYRLYTRTGEAVSKTAFDPNDRALGRVDRSHIPPPHSAVAIRRCIAKAEEDARYICGLLLEHNFATVPIAENAPVHLSRHSSRSGRPLLGASERNAVVLVEQERREGLFNRPVACMVSMDRGSHPRGWLFCVRGEVVFTDGVMLDAGDDGSIIPVPAYLAVSADKRNRGYISPGTDLRGSCLTLLMLPPDI